jgi:hypothetical protein
VFFNFEICFRSRPSSLRSVLPRKEETCGSLGYLIPPPTTSLPRSRWLCLPPRLLLPVCPLHNSPPGPRPAEASFFLSRRFSAGANPTSRRKRNTKKKTCCYPYQYTALPTQAWSFQWTRQHASQNQAALGLTPRRRAIGAVAKGEPPSELAAHEPKWNLAKPSHSWLSLRATQKCARTTAKI